VIALLRGEVALRRGDHVVILCGGVGYRASVSTETLRHVPAVGGSTSLHTHLIVRDDQISIYGFHSEQERDLFLMLLSVQAIGPKMAMAVLSGGGPRDLMSAIAAGDSARFQAVPGIGRRTAERIIVELREKVSIESGSAAAGPHALADTPHGLAREGLLELGYSAVEIERLLSGAEGDSAEELIAQALRAARPA
jgi:holliday junction DNA helicase RuvA